MKGNNIFRWTNTRRHYQNKHFSLVILSHLWRRQLGIKSVNLMRHVGDSRPPIQLPQGRGWKLLVSTPSLCQAYFFRCKVLFLHHWHKTYKLEHAITQTTTQGHSWEEDSCSCDEVLALYGTGRSAIRDHRIFQTQMNAFHILKIQFTQHPL